MIDDSYYSIICFRPLSVVFIVHYKVKRNSDKFIEIVPCFSAEDGLSKLSSGKYDVILCDFRPSDPIIGDIFSFYSSRFPIVAISSSDNPRDAQTAARMGALDY